MDSMEGFGGQDVGAEGGLGGGVGRLKHPEFLKVDGEVLERGLRDLVPSLCAYLRGHTEVSRDVMRLFLLTTPAFRARACACMEEWVLTKIKKFSPVKNCVICMLWGVPAALCIAVCRGFLGRLF